MKLFADMLEEMAQYAPKRLTQFALYCANQEIMSDMIIQLDAGEWAFDEAVHYGMYWPTENPVNWKAIGIRAHMAFNYNLIPGREFELMTWEYLIHNDFKHPFHDVEGISFGCVSYRVECAHQEKANVLRRFGLRPQYQFITQSHTNPNVAGKARYMDVMFHHSTPFGYLRCVSKLPHEPYFVVPRGSGVELNPYYWGHNLSDSYQLPNGEWIRKGFDPWLG